jgi:hypothetical protein
MKDVAIYSQSFTVVLTGLKLAAKAFDVPEKNLTVTLAPSDIPSGTITVQIRNTTQDEGRQLAKRIVDDLFDELILQFAQYIAEALPPEPSRPSIVNAAGQETLLIEVSDIIGGSTTTPRARYTVSDSQINTIATRVHLQLVTPQVATSAQIYSAKRMFSIGMQSDDKVVRFLILYSALSLAALFKYHNGKQEKVDMLLQQAVPALVLAPTGRASNMETVYTKIRNDFIHAEERAIDPSVPIQEIAQRLTDFQRDVSAVLRIL